MTQNEQTPTVNGIIKGRPGKGRVLSLEQRAKCYARHRMTPENTFRYRAKKVAGKPRPIVRAWCKRCRTDSRKRSRAKRLEEAKAAARAQKRETKSQLDSGMKPAAKKRSGKATPQVPALAGMSPMGKRTSSKRSAAKSKAA